MNTVAPPRPAQHDTGGQCAGPVSRGPAHWPLERVLFVLAGTMTGLSAILSAVVSPWFLLLTGFVAANQLLFSTYGNCPASWLLRRYAGLRGWSEQR